MKAPRARVRWTVHNKETKYICIVFCPHLLEGNDASNGPLHSLGVLRPTQHVQLTNTCSQQGSSFSWVKGREELLTLAV